MTKSQPDFYLAIPEGDDKERRICRQCDFIDYQNPKIVAGSVVRSQNNQILLCKRAIKPETRILDTASGVYGARRNC